jgi:hypothetical protein
MPKHRTQVLVGLTCVIIVCLSIAFALYRAIGRRPEAPAMTPSVAVDGGMNFTPAITPEPEVGAMPANRGDYVEVPAINDLPITETLNVLDTVQGQQMLNADIAVEADYEYFHRTFKGDMVRAQSYVTKLLTAVSAIYERDIHVRLRLAYLRIATQPDDPWTAQSISDALVEVKKYWTANEATRPRSVVLFLSGKNLGGGLAYRSGLCTADFGYAVIGSLKGSFTSTPSNNTWDLVSAAHELGHVFGSKHSFCYKRDGGRADWYDQCYSAQESSGCYSGPARPTNGTIMSYCYVAGGSMSHIDPISFSDGDPAMTNVMRQTAQNSLAANGSGCANAAPEAMPPSAAKNMRPPLFTRRR